MLVDCPNCKHRFETRKIKKGVRICCLCNKNIGKHDKWFFNSESKVQHRHCDKPTEYTKDNW